MYQKYYENTNQCTSGLGSPLNLHTNLASPPTGAEALSGFLVNSGAAITVRTNVFTNNHSTEAKGIMSLLFFFEI